MDRNRIQGVSTVPAGSSLISGYSGRRPKLWDHSSRRFCKPGLGSWELPSQTLTFFCAARYQFGGAPYNMVVHRTIWLCTVQYGGAPYNMVVHRTIWWCTVQYCSAPYNMVVHRTIWWCTVHIFVSGHKYFYLDEIY